MITANIENKLQQEIEALFDRTTTPNWESVAGGSINHSYRVHSGNKHLFIKVNNANAFPNMFQAEAKGLKLLRQHSLFHIPELIATGEAGNEAYLAMEWLEKGTPGKNFWDDFAADLARLHRNNHDKFGLDHDNYIGSLAQQNKQHESWAEFYITMRLEPQLRLATEKGLAGITIIRAFDRLFNRLEDLFPQEPPALLHGDLWRGNFMCHQSGKATIFDPAVYYGHREMDLAMTRLFGGFEAEFYEHYHRHFPLENDWEERIPLGQLYPLLVHVNLFGAGYLSQLKSCLRPFV